MQKVGEKFKILKVILTILFVSIFQYSFAAGSFYLQVFPSAEVEQEWMDDIESSSPMHRVGLGGNVEIDFTRRTSLVLGAEYISTGEYENIANMDTTIANSTFLLGLKVKLIEYPEQVSDYYDREKKRYSKKWKRYRRKYGDLTYPTAFEGESIDWDEPFPSYWYVGGGVTYTMAYLEIDDQFDTGEGSGFQFFIGNQFSKDWLFEGGYSAFFHEIEFDGFPDDEVRNRIRGAYLKIGMSF